MASETENSFTEDVSFEENMLVRARRMIKYLEATKKKKAFFDYKEVSYESFDNRSDKYVNFLETVERTEKKVVTLQQEIKDIEEEILLYAPFKENDLNLQSMKETKYVTFYHGFIYDKTVEALEAFFVEHHIPYAFFDSNQKGVAVTFALYKDQQTYYQEVRRLDFKEVELPNKDMVMAKYLMELYELKTKKTVSLEGVLNDIDSYTEHLEKLYIYADQLASDKRRKLTPLKKAETRLDIIHITGWIKEPDIEKLHKLLEKSKLGYEIEVHEPASDEVVPTALKNNKFVESFEVITEQYSMPSQKDLDPNPAMSFWYWAIFGMMMGDVGYGLVMLLAFGLFLKLKRPKGGMKKLVSVLYYSGYTTIFFGAIYGSLFGYDFISGLGKLFNQSWKPLITPIDNALEMLVIAMGIGMIHIIHGLILKAKLLIKFKDPFGVLAESVSYILILLGVAVTALTFIDLPFNLSPWVGYGMLISGAALIILFAGRHHKSIIKKATSGLAGIYGIIDQLSDVLSYSRILALALSTAVIAFTFNLLAGMLHGSIFGILISIVIYIVGHVFNFGMGLLSAYIHDSRLQYIEFFGKFYEGGGIAFKPLSLELNYIDEINNINNNIGGI